VSKQRFNKKEQAAVPSKILRASSGSNKKEVSGSIMRASSDSITLSASSGSQEQSSGSQGSSTRCKMRIGQNVRRF